MWFKLISTKDDISLFLLRVSVGSVIFAHGAQKMLGWFGGHGPADTVANWSEWFGFHPLVTWTFIITEFMAPVLLIAGFLSRITASLFIVMMLGAMYFVTFRWGFFMNWYSDAQRGEGFEMHLLVIVISLVIIIKGSGRWSIDYALMKRY